MRSIIKRIFDTVRPYNGAPVVATKGDRGLRYINATICTDGYPQRIPASCTAKIKYYREFNAAQREQACQIDADGTITIQIDDWALEEDGLLWCWISIKSGADGEIKTSRFPLVVTWVGASDPDDDPDPDDPIDPDPGEGTKTYVVHFEANGGGGSMEDDFVNAGSSYTIPGCGFTKPEYKTFKGWKIDNEGQLYLQNSIIAQVNSDITLYAQWVDTEYTVRFFANGGSGGMKSLTKKAGIKFTVPKCEFNPPTGKTFKCWKKNNTGAELYADEDELEVMGNIYLYAQWEDDGQTPEPPGSDEGGQTQNYNVYYASVMNTTELNADNIAKFSTYQTPKQQSGTYEITTTYIKGADRFVVAFPYDLASNISLVTNPDSFRDELEQGEDFEQEDDVEIDGIKYAVYSTLFEAVGTCGMLITLS